MTKPGTILAATLLAACASTGGVPDEMQAWLDATAPNEVHAELMNHAGKWHVDVTTWDTPDAPAQQSEAFTVIKPMFDGRYLQESFHGEMAGLPFDGRGYVGYDRAAGEYTSVWMDSLSTGVFVSTGTSDDGGRTIDWAGSMANPMTGEPMDYRMRSTTLGRDEMLFEMWMPAPDGSGEFKHMEMRYSRRSG